MISHVIENAPFFLSNIYEFRLDSSDFHVLGGELINDITPFSEGLNGINWLDLSGNEITDITPLETNENIRGITDVLLGNNPLDCDDSGTLWAIQQMENRGAYVSLDCNEK